MTTIDRDDSTRCLAMRRQISLSGDDAADAGGPQKRYEEIAQERQRREEELAAEREQRKEQRRQREEELARDRQMREEQFAEERHQLKKQMALLQQLVMDKTAHTPKEPGESRPSLKLSRLLDADDIEAYLITFERSMEAYEVDKSR